MTSDAFLHICNNFSKGSFAVVTIKANRFNFFKANKKKMISSPNLKFGPELGPMMDWLDEFCTEMYYPRFKKQRRSYQSYRDDVDFYFMDEKDAVAFTLRFMDYSNG